MQTLQKIEDYLKGVSYFSLATTSEDKPKVRPLGFHLLLNEQLYFGVGDFKEVYKQIRKNAFVELIAVKENDWLRYYGKAIFEQDNKIANIVLEKAPTLQKIYNKDTGFNLAIFHLEGATAEFRNNAGVIIESFEV